MLNTVEDYSVPTEFIEVILEQSHTFGCKCVRCCDNRQQLVTQLRVEEKKEVMEHAKELIAQYFHCSTEQVDFLPVGRLFTVYRKLVDNRNYNRFLDQVRQALKLYFDQYQIERTA